MLSIIRMYPSEGQAREAIRLLEEEDLIADQNKVHLFSPVPGSEAQTIQDAIADGKLPSDHIHVCTRALQKGNSVLTVYPPFVRGSEAEQIMQGCGAVDTDDLPEYYVSNGTPLSDILGLPLLTSYKHTFNIKMLTERKSKTSSFGIPLLTKSKSKTSSFGIPLLSKSKSKTSSFGIPLLTKAKSKNSSMGLPLLTKGKSKNSSFGLPLLSSNPAPLSNMFNFRLLSKKSQD